MKNYDYFLEFKYPAISQLSIEKKPAIGIVMSHQINILKKKKNNKNKTNKQMRQEKEVNKIN